MQQIYHANSSDKEQDITGLVNSLLPTLSMEIYVRPNNLTRYAGISIPKGIISPHVPPTEKGPTEIPEWVPPAGIIEEIKRKTPEQPHIHPPQPEDGPFTSDNGTSIPDSW